VPLSCLATPALDFREQTQRESDADPTVGLLSHHTKAVSRRTLVFRTTHQEIPSIWVLRDTKAMVLKPRAQGCHSRPAPAEVDVDASARVNYVSPGGGSRL
jgi:hypothetical protein